MLIRHSFFSILLFLLCLVSCCAYASETDIDPELEQQLDRHIELSQEDRDAGLKLIAHLTDTSSHNPAIQSRARLLCYLATNAFFDKNVELSDSLLSQLTEMAAQSDNQNMRSEIYATELELLLLKQKLSEAIIKSDQAVQALEQASEPRIKYFSHNVLGRIFKADAQYQPALQHFISALDALSENENALKLRRQAFLNYHIAQVHVELKNWPEARQITEQLLTDSIKYQHTNFLPELYLLLGYISRAEKNFLDAIKIYKKGLEVVVAAGWEDFALTFENNIGAAYIELEQYSAAKTVLLKALQLAEKLDDADVQHIIKLNLGYIRVMDGEHAAGIAQMKVNLAYFEKNMSKAQYEPYYEWLTKAYAAAGLYQQQAESLLVQKQLREDIRTAEREARLDELQNRYDNKAKAQKIIILEQENTLKAQLLENKKLQQKLMFLFVLLILFAGAALLMLYRKVRRSNRKLNETNKQLAFQSQRDPLTGLYNRRALQQHMQRRSERLSEQDASEELTGLLLIDIDFFKRINDQYGHSAGDAVLIELSKRLLATCREHDLVVRWGGEEVLLLLDSISATQLPDFIKRIMQVISERPVIFEQHSIKVTASGGFIHLPFAGVSEEQLNWEKIMQIIDMALYLSKANGRNQVCMINGLKVSFEQAENLLYSDLAGAIDNNMVDVTVISGESGTVS